MRAPAIIALSVLACGGRSADRTPAERALPVGGCGADGSCPSAPLTASERMVALLPDGAQVIVEIDLARLRANAVVGELVQRASQHLGGLIPGLAAVESESLLATSKGLVIAAYGVGTVHAATVALVATEEEPKGPKGSVRVAPDLVAFGPEAWTGQLATRAALVAEQPPSIPGPLRDLRARSVPHGATGAVLRISVQLSFDARIAFARMIGMEAPAQLSLWSDIADDAALVLEADATDPGTENPSSSGRRFAETLRQALAVAGRVPIVRALGLAPSLERARIVQRGRWAGAVIVMGPRHLARVVERARAMLPPRHETP